MNLRSTRLYLLWGTFSLSGFTWACVLAWLLLASVDFAYPILHDTLDIEQHTLKYGPQNRYRKGFEHTSREERIRLFSEITTSIHQNGQGLKALTYHDGRTGKPIDKLLHTSEIIHLTDVAHLVNKVLVLGAVTFLLWIGFMWAFVKGWIKIPGLKQLLMGTIAFVSFSALLVIIIGPVEVFYAFHEWLFPPNHKWFFYYQESLMTILMKAPILFGYIAILITLLGLLIFIPLHRWLLKRANAFQSKQASSKMPRTI